MTSPALTSYYTLDWFHMCFKTYHAKHSPSVKFDTTRVPLKGNLLFWPMQCIFGYFYKYTLATIYLVLWSRVSHCKWLLQFEITVFYFNYISNLNLFLWCKAEYSALITPVSHDSSEIILKCWFVLNYSWCSIIIFHIFIVLFCCLITIDGQILIMVNNGYQCFTA